MSKWSVDGQSRRLLAIILLGPIIGGLSMLALNVVVEGLPELEYLGPVIFMFMVFGFLFGVLPAILAALVYLRLEPRLKSAATRCCAAIGIGFVTSMLGVYLILLSVGGETLFSAPEILRVGLSGALALLFTTSPWRANSPQA